MHIKDVCNLYIHGQNLRKQAKNISRRNLATKFERSIRTITKICDGLCPENIEPWEIQLIRDLDSEHKRMLSEAYKLTQPKLADAHGYTKDQIFRQLQIMGFDRGAFHV